MHTIERSKMLWRTLSLAPENILEENGTKQWSTTPELIQGPGVLPNWGGKQVVKREGGW